MKHKIIKKMALLLMVAIISVLAISNKSFAQTVASQAAERGYYRMPLGDFEVIALLDGTTPQNLDELLKGAKPGEINKATAANVQTAIINCSVNAYLIKTKTKLILIDAGTSDVYGPSLGHLTANLKKAGYLPEQIDAVLLTHTHMDHIGGLMTGNKITFANAQVYLSKTEADYYLSAANKQHSPEAMKRFFDGAEQKLRPIINAGKLKTFEFGKEIFAGITPVASIGHSAGHTFYVVKSKGQKMIFWGDIILSDLVQFADPSVYSVYDYEAAEAIDVRKKALADAARAGNWVAVSHIDFPGIGHVEADGKGGYRFVNAK